MFEQKVSPNVFKKLKSLGKITLNNQYCEIHYEPSKTSIDDIISFLKKNRIKILDLKTREVNLEDIFLMLTRK